MDLIYSIFQKFLSDMRPKLTGDLLDTAVEIATNEPLTLHKIKEAVAAHHPDARDFSIGHWRIQA